jgi:hypothetical protein
MSTTQKSLLALGLIAVGAAVFEWHQASQLREQVRSLRDQRDASAEQMQQLQGELEDARGRLSTVQGQEPAPKLSQNTAELLGLRTEVARLRSEKLAQATDPFTVSVLGETTRAARLNQQLALAPEKRIPELQYLTLTDWLDAASGADLESDAGVRKALSRLRRLAKNRLYPAWQRAFRSYLDNNGNQLPTDLAQLKPYFEAPVDDTILTRYQLLVTGNANALKPGDYILSERAPADQDYDERYEMGLGHDRWTHF